MAMGILELKEFRQLQAIVKHHGEILEEVLKANWTSDVVQKVRGDIQDAYQDAVDESTLVGRAIPHHTGFGRWVVLYDGIQVPVVPEDQEDWIMQGCWYTKKGAVKKAAMLNG
tara:strand:+ start:381 stop:719 length:339 start_codon:yes stop_codon:yes gene_type:complete